jgi:tRNA(fMet)-specific endonuclease VapC
VRILDTDTCIYILRGRAEVINKRRSVYDEVATTIVTACELYYGAAKSQKPVAGKQAVDSFLRTLRVLDLDPYAAQFFGAIKAGLEQDGTGLADADLMIGSIARRHHAIVVTGNTHHFERIPGITLENWIPGR